VASVPVNTNHADMYGKGPTKGAQVLITLTNLDTAQGITVQIFVGGTTQHIARDDWRNGHVNSVPGVVFSNLLAQANLLVGVLTFSVPASSSNAWSLPLYSGQAWCWFQVSAAIAVTIFPNNSLPSQFSPGYLLYSATVSTTATTSVQLPRVPCLVRFENTSGSAITVDVMVTSLEYAS